jgi:hypothetical protein
MVRSESQPYVRKKIEDVALIYMIYSDPQRENTADSIILFTVIAYHLVVNVYQVADIQMIGL